MGYVPNISKNELIQQLSSEKFALQTIAQIEKDFSSCGVELKLEAQTPINYSDLTRNLSLSLDKVIREESHLFYQLLYRIDLNEASVTNEVKSNPNRNHAEVIAEMIIEREAKKVYLRTLFKK